MSQWCYQDPDGEYRWHDTPPPPRGALAQWPLLSDGAGVHPEQIGEARELAARAGVPTDFTADGRAIFTGPVHRQRYLQTRGIHDKDGAYFA